MGIVATFVSLYLMKAAQPALLFLVPFTLVPVFIISWLRGDLAAMWRGDFAEVMIFELLVFQKNTSIHFVRYSSLESKLIRAGL